MLSGVFILREIEYNVFLLFWGMFFWFICRGFEEEWFYCIVRESEFLKRRFFSD